ncbi:MAG: hypothetical protein ABIV51_05310 [Saprospiraceae bacterium]
MSKDRGTKNIKKAPADKAGKVKAISPYKTDRNQGTGKSPSVQAFVPKDTGSKKPS